MDTMMRDDALGESCCMLNSFHFQHEESDDPLGCSFVGR